ncbi:hypothetical protein Forpe1208_v014798 [Fusarium oxysporum f. sp. rapae]|uniref:Uncharacterized protein n=1 Tax=Fusarium oxysporum f. sp. rapae TaxID=485398 RepID=A0A8J5TQS0_FUSOX|nr:hypothetical protein Forpe1208_v014798 [Fusarium oxysporum f. sp. rapae]
MPEDNPQGTGPAKTDAPGNKSKTPAAHAATDMAVYEPKDAPQDEAKNISPKATAEEALGQPLMMQLRL